MHIALKTLITVFIVVAVSELARRYSLFAAVVASLPLTSILALIWLYQDTHDLQKVYTFSIDVLWLVGPSLMFFIALPFLIRQGLGFYASMLLSCMAMVLTYGAFMLVKSRLV